MNNRIDIKIVVLGEPNSGKETFCKMLFLDKCNRIRLDPLSRLGEIYAEIDPENFKHSSKNIVKECSEQNSLIMKQSQINNLDELRKNNIYPFFYRYTNRIAGLINENDPGRINRNILLTFQFIGNNYKDFSEEIEAANIIIYLIDINKIFDGDSELFIYLINMVKSSKGTKKLLPIVNKYDPNNKNHISTKISIGDTFKYFSEGNDIELTPVYISAKDAMIFRMMYYKIPSVGVIDLEYSDIIYKTYGIRMENSKDVIRNIDKYLDKCGFNNFRSAFMKILNKNYRTMVDVNFGNSLPKLEMYKNTDRFITHLLILRNKAIRLGKIFKTNYERLVIDSIKCQLEEMVYNGNIEDKLIDQIQKNCKDSAEIMETVKMVKEKMRDKILNGVLPPYAAEITPDLFLPSNVWTRFEKFIAMYPSKMQNEKMVTYICELYSRDVQNILVNQDINHIQMFYDAYFTEKETMKMMSILNEIKSMVDYDTYKNYLMKIFLTKLQIAEFIVYFKDNMALEILETIVSYCKSLRLYLSDNSHKKYSYLFINIADICTRIIFEMNSVSNAKYISDNIASFINFKCDKIINLDKFIIKMIKKTNYQAVVAEDDINSDDDSDVDIYGEENDHSDDESFNITNGDLIASDSEEIDDEPIKRIDNDDDLVEV